MKLINLFVAVFVPLFLSACGGGTSGSDAGTPTLGGGGSTALFTTAPSNLAVPLGSSSVQFTIGGGKPSYSVTTSDPTVASISVTGSSFVVSGLAGGSAIISIKDAVGAKVTLSVAVNISIIDLFTSAPASLTIAVGATTQQFTVNGGSAPYSVSSNDLTIASAGINGSRFIVNGVAGGKTAVTIKDAVGAFISIDVTVGSNSALYTTAPSQISVPVGAARSYVIAGGAAPYVATSSDANVASAVVTGAGLSISGIALGSTNVVVRDAIGAAVTIAIKVGSSASGSPLFTTAAADIVVAAGTKPSYAVGGGTGPYIVSSSNAAVAMAEVSGSTLSISGIAVGRAKIALLDAAGARVEINVVVGTGPVVELYTTAPGSVTLANGASQTYTVGGGVGPYVASSSNVGVVTSSLNGSTLTVAGVRSGPSQVSIFDSAGKSVSINITVSASTAFFTTAPDNVSISIGEVPLYTVSGGVAPYVATSSNTSVATVSQSPGAVTIAGVAAGVAKVSVRDSSGGLIIVNVTVLAGVALSTTAPVAVTIAPSAPGNVASYVIAGGVRPYFASSGNATVVEAVASDASLTLRAISSGSATVQVRDSAGAAVSIAVTVAAVPALYTYAPSAVTLATGVSASYGVGGGTPGYTPTSSDARVAQVSQLGASLTISGKAAGTATVTVRDSVGSSVLITVTVGSPIKLFVSAPSAVTILPTPAASLPAVPALTQSYSVGGGEGPYTAASSNSSIATAGINASTLSITGVAAGSASVVVSDALGATVTIAVTVTPAASIPLAVTPLDATAAVGDTLTFTISGGDPKYNVVINNASVATITNPLPPNSEGTFTAMLLNAGATTIAVIDAKGQTQTIKLTVTQVQPLLRLSPSSIAVSELNKEDIVLNIYGGAGLYSVFTSDMSLSKVSVDPTNATVTVKVGAAGNRCITPASLGYLPPGGSNSKLYGDWSITFGSVGVVVTLVDGSGRSTNSALIIVDNATTCP